MGTRTPTPGPQPRGHPGTQGPKLLSVSRALPRGWPAPTPANSRQQGHGGDSSQGSPSFSHTYVPQNPLPSPQGRQQ